MAKLIEKLEIGEVHLVGISYGGRIALNLAVRYPSLVDRIVCIEEQPKLNQKRFLGFR